jgi:hypothetical protein
MTRTILGHEFAVVTESKHSTTWRCGNITLTCEGDPMCYRAECLGLKSMFHRAGETALTELFRLAEEMVLAAELVRAVREKEEVEK